VWFTEISANKVGRITMSGVVTEYLPPSAGTPAGITTGPDGNMWVVELYANKIARLWLNGSPPSEPPSEPQNLTASTNRPRGVTLSWSPPSSPGTSPVSGYRVYRGTASGDETMLTSVAGVTGYTDTATSKGTTYFYRVTAVSAAGEGPASNEAAARAG
jgi:hypothetical protein